MSALLTLDLDPEIMTRIDSLAAERAMTRDDVLKLALAEFLDAQSDDLGTLLPWQRDRIERGIDEADRGVFASRAEMGRIASKHRPIK